MRRGREALGPYRACMHEELHWTTEGQELLQDCAVFRVSRTSARSPLTGDVRPFFRLDSADWVNIVPITDDGDVVMVRQYRHGSRRVTLEIPGGMVDAGESPADAAARELLEETGYAAAEVRRLGDVNPNPALWGNRCHTYAADGVRRVGPIRNEGTEQTVVELVPLDDVPARIQAGDIDHALVIVAFHWFGLSPRR